jgi:hypothetical protein
MNLQQCLQPIGFFALSHRTVSESPALAHATGVVKHAAASFWPVPSFTMKQTPRSSTVQGGCGRCPDC